MKIITIIDDYHTAVAKKDKSLNSIKIDDVIFPPESLQKDFNKTYENYCLYMSKDSTDKLKIVMEKLLNWISSKYDKGDIVYLNLPKNLCSGLAIRLHMINIESYSKISPLMKYIFF